MQSRDGVLNIEIKLILLDVGDDLDLQPILVLERFERVMFWVGFLVSLYGLNKMKIFGTMLP